ncbi:NADH-quinone oxidoreductase subunit J [Paracoccus mangrovi]|uniref:NADH-quinone oxidoreductase subunit J n=1 Tax=Paracoccus mangrovi TaxID=1715645 RepID=A0ABV7R8U0_9RHOB
MMIFAFYLFAICACVAGFMVVIGRNPVHSVLWLILAFFSAAGLFVLQGAEFVAMLLIVVYVGAVAVLFLFVVMMLDVDFAELKGELARYLPLGLLIGLVMLAQLGMALSGWTASEAADGLRAAPIVEGVQNTRGLGAVLYDRYALMFQMSGLVLLVAMIGAIVLTMRHRKDVKRQNVLEQMWRDPAKQLELKDVKPGQGL